MIRLILLDIEGTTSSIDFVHKTMFPYALERLKDFVHSNRENDSVRHEIQGTIQTIYEEEGKRIDWDEAIETLKNWIKEDRKQTNLKNLQGMIWKRGMESGEFKGHVYPDVAPKMKEWVNEGYVLGIYSSGSVTAQKLYFTHSDAGDLHSLLDWHFDTNIGHKRERDSYLAILKETGFQADEVLFLSDVEQELDAAKAAGLHTIQLVRPGTPASERHPQAKDFSMIRPGEV